MSNSTTSVTWPAMSTVEVGDAVVERDGYLFAVIAIEKLPRGMIKLALANEFSPLRITREGQQSITRRASTKVAIARGAGWDVAPTLLHRAITTDLAALAASLEG